MVKKLRIRLAVLTQYRRVTDGQTSCDSIAHTMHTHCVVKIHIDAFHYLVLKYTIQKKTKSVIRANNKKTTKFIQVHSVVLVHY